MNGEDKKIAKLKEENDYLKSLLWIHNISFEKPKEIKQLQHQNKSNKMSAFPIGKNYIAFIRYSYSPSNP